MKAKVSFSSAGLTDFSLRAFDIHKLANNKIGALYCGLDKSQDPNARVCLHVEYHYDTDKAYYYPLDASPYTWRTLSIGTHTSYTGKDVWITNGAISRNIASYDTAGKDEGQQMSRVNTDLISSSRAYPVYYSSVLKNNVYTAGFQKIGVSCYAGDSSDSCKNVESFSWKFTTNCFNKIIDPTEKKDYYCGGSHIIRMTANADNYLHRMIKIQSSNLISGVVYQKWQENTIYLYQNEDTKTVFNPKSKTRCYDGIKNGIDTHIYFCKDKTYCEKCDINTGEYCIKCRGGRIALNGECVNPPCPGYMLESECFHPHCPYGYYKDGTPGAGNCVPNDCSSAGGGRNFIFGDFCTICTFPMVQNGFYCDCPAGKIRNEDNTCILDGGSPTKCPSPKKYMWHLGMCVDTVRNSTDYITSGSNIYCDHSMGRFVDLSNSKKCIDTCPSTKYKGTHLEYGLICVTSAECTSLSYTTSESPKVCEKKCLNTEYLNPDTGICVTTCPSNKYYSPTGYTPKSCLGVCPGPSSSPAHTIQTWGIASTQKCVELAACKAIIGMNTYNTTWVCINDTVCK